MGESRGLVMDRSGDLAQLFLVLAGMVGAEKEFQAAIQLSTNIGLCSTTVATVGGVEGSRGGNSSRHV